jgi:tRNA dimethylallyltransferase
LTDTTSDQRIGPADGSVADSAARPVTGSDEERAPEVVAVVGPTAVGKTDLAERLCIELDGEVVSADSMQVYRGMDVGTAKPERPTRVRYHCIDLVQPGEDYSAALFQRDARRAIEEARARGKLPVVAGGTGLYVRAALDDLEFPPGHARTETRERLEREAADEGAEAMLARLRAVDPESASLIHPNNTRRVIRALELAEHGESYARMAERFRERRSVYPTTFVGLDMDREHLYQRIDERVDRMISEGLLEEVEDLLRAGLRDALTAAQAIGYKELVPVVEEDRPLERAVEDIKQASRRYAKRQLTWFRRDPRVHWLDVTDLTPDEVLREALGLLESSRVPVDRSSRVDGSSDAGPDA